MAVRDKQPHQSNHYKATQGSGKKRESSRSKKSINQLLGIGKPGPHLLKHQKLKEKKAGRRLKYWDNTPDATAQGDSHSHRHNHGNSENHSYYLRRRNGGDGNSTQQSKSPIIHNVDRRRSAGHSNEASNVQRLPSQQLPRIPQHRHHDSAAHAGAYSDEYDQDLQYQYSPGLWEPPALNKITNSQPQQHIGSNSQSWKRPNVTGGADLQGSKSNPYETSEEGLPKDWMRLHQNKGVAPSQLKIDSSVVAAPLSKIVKPEPLPTPIPTVADLRKKYLEKIKDRKTHLKMKKAQTNTEPAPPHEAYPKRRKRAGPYLKGQDSSYVIADMLDNTADALGRDGFQRGSDFIRLASAVAPPLVSSAKQKRKRSPDYSSDTEGSAEILPEPWMQHRRYSNTPSATIMLNNEAKDFVTYLSPTREEHQARTFVYERVRKAVEKLWRGAVVKLFGSFETQLYLPTSDLDIVVFRTESFTKHDLYSLKSHLEYARIGEDFEVVTHAKVPLVKFKETISNIAVDISFNVANGVEGAALTKRYMDDTPGLRSLTMLVKHFLKLRRCNEPFHGGVGSFLTVIMVMSFLQMHPTVQGKWIDPDENLGVLLIEFFELYGICFNYEDVGLTVANGGSYFPRSQRSQDESQFGFCALDPNDPTNNVARAAKNIHSVQSQFATALTTLVSAVEERQKHLNENDVVAVKASLIKGVLNIPHKTMLFRHHMEMLYSSGQFQTL
ncbi:Non-canonical poly(A) RNA polymerase papd5 [Mortierella sp. AM989]|nr:Non-canonical poly(A) RNA polymerase papd5 [Mortierella sp. AM989]